MAEREILCKKLAQQFHVTDQSVQHDMESLRRFFRTWIAQEIQGIPHGLLPEERIL